MYLDKSSITKEKVTYDTNTTILAYPLLSNYNGEKGKTKWLKWFFYAYYPLHLFVIGILRIMVYGNIPLLFN